MEENREAYFYCPACSQDSITAPEKDEITCPKCKAVWSVVKRVSWLAVIRILA